MSSPEKKKRKKSSPTLTSLPDDLLLNCLARVSRLYYPTLSLVSKSFRSLLASRGLYKTRSLLGRTESFLYVWIDSYSCSNPSWYTLYRKPDQTLTNEDDSSGYVLAKVPIMVSPPLNARGLVAVGSSIYNISISEFGSESESSNVSVLDCKSHTWAPSFPVELWPHSSSVLDEKIYVVGYYKEKDDDSLLTCCMVLDTKTQIWDHIPLPLIVTITNIACVNGKLHGRTGGREVIAYNSKEGRWDSVGGCMGDYMDSDHAYCVIDNVLYSASGVDLRWYDTEVREWKRLKGLVGLRQFDARVKLVDYGGKLVVLWDECSFHFSNKMIWCAEIVLEKKGCEIWGNVEWCDHVLTLPNSGMLVKGLTATI